MLKEVDIAASLHQKGFVLIDADLLAEIKELNDFIEHNYPITSDDFYYSLIANDYGNNLVIKSFISDTLSAFYDRYFDPYHSRNESFLSKPKQTATELLLHQDWNYTDESKFAVYNVWIPLRDVNTDNGAMFFLPGSHLWLNNLRSATLPTARIASHSFSNDDMEVVEMKSGQVLVFHPAVFHGSMPNKSNNSRTIITSTIAERDAPFCYYQKDETDEQVKIFSLKDDAFMKGLHELSFGADPEGTVTEVLSYKHREVTADLLESHLAQQKKEYRYKCI